MWCGLIIYSAVILLHVPFALCGNNWQWDSCVTRMTNLLNLWFTAHGYETRDDTSDLARLFISVLYCTGWVGFWVLGNFYVFSLIFPQISGMLKNLLYRYKGRVLECRLGAHPPLGGCEPVGGYTTKVCDTWLVRCQTYGYLPSCRASPLFSRYKIILFGTRHMDISNLPELLSDGAPTGSQTRDLSITSQTH